MGFVGLADMMNISIKSPTMNSKLFVFPSLLLAAILCTGCGGGDDTVAAATPTSGGSGPTPTVVVTTPTTTTSISITSANLVVSAATPVSVNGTLNKAAPAVLYESTVGNSTGNFSSAGPNDYCRVAAYDMPNSGNGAAFSLEVVFSKTTKVASYAMLSQTSGTPTFAARAIEPNLGGITVDVANRRLGFSGVVLGTGGSNSATLNGSLEYPTNGSIPDRPNCG